MTDQLTQDHVAAAVTAAVANDPRILTGGPDHAYPIEANATPGPIEAIAAPTIEADATHPADEAIREPIGEVAQVTAEKVLTRHPSFGSFVVGPDGSPVWPPQPVLDDLHGPDQTYWDIPADAVYWSDAARLMAEGWQPPFPKLHEVIRQREAFRLAIARAAARRSDTGPIVLAIRAAADLVNPDPIPAIVDAIEAAALDGWLSTQLGVEGSRINGISYELESSYRTLLFDNQRSVLASLVGRDSGSARNLRALVESMSRMLTLAPMTPNAYLVYP